MEERLFATHSDLEDRHWWFRGRRRAILELGVRLLPEHGRIVDVGCGTGADIDAFPSSHERYGIDRSREAIDLARAAHPGVTFVVGDVPDVGGDLIAGAELVLLCDVLEHVGDDHGFLAALTGTMKPGAHLLLTVPADPRLWSPHDVVYQHSRRYTRETLAGAWAGSPMEPKLLAPLNRRLYPVARVARAASALRGRGWGSESSDLVLPWGPVNTARSRVFGGEAAGLTRALDSGRREVPGRGISLLAILQRVGDSTPAQEGGEGRASEAPHG
jgi:SAM-dependent methyltransferase